MNKNYCPTYTYTLIDGKYTKLLYGHFIERHKHIFWEMEVSLKGTYLNHFDSGDIEINPSELVIIRPDDIHYIDLRKNDAVYRDLYFSDDEMHEFSDFIKLGLYDELKNKEYPIRIKIDPAIVSSVDSFSRFISLNKSMLSVETIDSLRKAICSELLGEYVRSNIPTLEKVPEWITKITSRLEVTSMSDIDNFNLSIDDIVKETNYSHGHVCREFKKYIGKSLISYINEQKISFSTILLSNPDYTVTQISSILGYSNHSNFINAFKKQYRTSPTLWKKNGEQIIKKSN